MRSYADDMEARLADLTSIPEEQKAITDLTFAESRLLHIHPFKDFNGRVSRLFLTEVLCRLDLAVVGLCRGAIWRRRFAMEAG